VDVIACGMQYSNPMPIWHNVASGLRAGHCHTSGIRAHEVWRWHGKGWQGASPCICLPPTTVRAPFHSVGPKGRQVGHDDHSCICVSYSLMARPRAS